MARRNPLWRVPARITLLCGLVALVAASCSGKHGTGPHESSSRVYVSIASTPPTVLVFDTQSDSLIDSAKIAVQSNFAIVTCDPDKPRFAVLHHPDIFLFTADGEQPYGVFQLMPDNFEFDAGRGVIVGTQGDYGGVIAPRVDIYDAETLVLMFTDSVAMSDEIQLDRRHGLVYGISNYEDSLGAPVYRNELCAYDYVNRRLYCCWNILPDSATKRGYFVTGFGLHPDGRRVYLVASRLGGGVRIVGYDLELDTVLFDHPMYSIYGQPEVSPDGNQVWVPETGYDNAYDPGTVVIRDARTGAVQSVVELDTYRLLPQLSVRPRYIRFTPDGNKAYVTSIASCGPIFSIDVKTLAVNKVWYTDGAPNFRRNPWSMDIGPAPD